MLLLLLLLLLLLRFFDMLLSGLLLSGRWVSQKHRELRQLCGRRRSNGHDDISFPIVVRGRH